MRTPFKIATVFGTLCGIGFLASMPALAVDNNNETKNAITMACGAERSACISVVGDMVLKIPAEERAAKIKQIVPVLQGLAVDAAGEPISQEARRPLVAAVSYLASLQTDTKEQMSLQTIAMAIRAGK